MIKPFKNADKQISQFYSTQHEAIDFYGKYGTPLTAPEDGEIIWNRKGTYTPGDNTELKKGYNIRLKGTYEWLFEHCQPVFPVSVGEKVKAGQIIAYMGNSGAVMTMFNGQFRYVPVEERTQDPHLGTHLHLECFENGKRINPLPLLTEEPNYSVFDQLKAMSVTIGKIAGLIAVDK